MDVKLLNDDHLNPPAGDVLCILPELDTDIR